jgi:tRNA (guanine26-N2/guanine27-N2)-dimethyltransferase
MSSNKITIPEIPDGFTLHTENNSHILLSSNEAFLNPVQEFNRDTSVACIRVWSEELHKSKKAKWLRTQEKKQTKQKKRKRELRGLDLCINYHSIKSLC